MCFYRPIRALSIPKLCAQLGNLGIFHIESAFQAFNLLVFLVELGLQALGELGKLGDRRSEPFVLANLVDEKLEQIDVTIAGLGFTLLNKKRKKKNEE